MEARPRSICHVSTVSARAKYPVTSSIGVVCWLHACPGRSHLHNGMSCRVTVETEGTREGEGKKGQTSVTSGDVLDLRSVGAV